MTTTGVPSDIMIKAYKFFSCEAIIELNIKYIFFSFDKSIDYLATQHAEESSNVLN